MSEGNSTPVFGFHLLRLGKNGRNPGQPASACSLMKGCWGPPKPSFGKIASQITRQTSFLGAVCPLLFLKYRALLRAGGCGRRLATPTPGYVEAHFSPGGPKSSGALKSLRTPIQTTNFAGRPARPERGPIPGHRRGRRHGPSPTLTCRRGRLDAENATAGAGGVARAESRV